MPAVIGPNERVVVAIGNFDLGAERRAAADVGGDGLGGPARAIHQHDLAGTAADRRRQRARAADSASSDDPDLHVASTLCRDAVQP
jgi:hypothetical protein